MKPHNRNMGRVNLFSIYHGLRTPREELAFTARPKIQSQSQIFRYGGSIFCLPHRPIFSDILDLCLHWVSVVRGIQQTKVFYDGLISESFFTLAQISKTKVLTHYPGHLFLWWIVLRTVIWHIFWRFQPLLNQLKNTKIKRFI